MRTRPTVLYFSPAERPVPDLISSWLGTKPFVVIPFCDRDELETVARRSPPVLIVIDADGAGDDGPVLCRSLKGDAFSAIVPIVSVAGRHGADRVQQWFEAGADEVITPLFEPAEQRSRLEVLLARTERNVAVHPSTRLPGTTEIERDLRERLDKGQLFAICYADLDHFKEFNDRYSYYDGDRVILLVSRILRDVVKGLCPQDGFLGHIGGDDFIIILPLGRVQEVCSEIIAVFDCLIPFQYSAQDRRAGYFFGKDRRGHLHRVPLMTLSIGIVTNENHVFTHPAEVSETATEMKMYAKTLPGSVFVVDRRRDADRGQ
ncbi:MAG: diguanylate cyclase [Gemmatimonadales bacterium]